MPTAQDIFPKVGNDPLYDSEVNRLNRISQTIFAGSTINIGSSTATQTIGSHLINNGSFLGNSFGTFVLDFIIDGHNSNPMVFEMLVSGTPGLGSHFISGISASNTRLMGTIKSFIIPGSAASSFGGLENPTGFLVQGGITSVNSVATPYSQLKSSPDMVFHGSPYVVFVNAKHANAESFKYFYKLVGEGIN